MRALSCIVSLTIALSACSDSDSAALGDANEISSAESAGTAIPISTVPHVEVSDLIDENLRLRLCLRTLSRVTEALYELDRLNREMETERIVSGRSPAETYRRVRAQADLLFVEDDTLTSDCPGSRYRDSGFWSHNDIAREDVGYWLGELVTVELQQDIMRNFMECQDYEAQFGKDC